MKRKFVPTTTTTVVQRQPPRKRRATRRYQGLVPTYYGYNPRNFRQGEWKAREFYPDCTIATTAQLFCMNGISEGNTYQTRVGSKVSIQSIEMRFYTQSIPFTGTDQVHRVFCFIDRQANGSMPAITDYLKSPNTLAMRNLNSRKRFKTIMDRTYIVNAAPEPFDHKYNHVYIKFRKPIVTEYNSANTGTISDIVTNSLIFGCIGNKADTLAGYLWATVRIRYTDI